MKFRTPLATLLQLALQPTHNMIKCKPAHPFKTLRLHSESPTGCPLHSERDTPGSICLRGLASANSRHEQSGRRGSGLLVSMLGVLLLVLLVLLMLFGAGGDMGILFREAEDTGDDFVVGCPCL